MVIKDILMRVASTHPERVVLRYRREGGWHEETYAHLYTQARQVSEMLAEQGIGRGDRVAIFLANAPEWYALYFGIVALGAVAVPMDVKLREQEVRHIFHDCGVVAVFCAQKSLETIRGVSRGRVGVKTVIVLQGSAEDLPQSGEVVYQAYAPGRYEGAERASCAFHRTQLEPDDPASYMYTSGTTGRQKGAVLTHRNFLSNVESCLKVIEANEEDNLMLILPLHHAFAFTTTLLLPIYVGASVSIVESMKTIKRDMAYCQPTVMLAVPLLLEKMLARIKNGIEQRAISRWIFRLGGGHWIGRKMKAELGGQIRLIVSGGAPICPKALRTWERLGFMICEGYGITETAPVLTFNPLGKARVGTVGLPLAGVEVEIVEPNEAGVGEIRARGPNVMKGYYNHPEETARVLKDHWYYTGDLGFFDEAGYLVISGRKKSLIVNREGKNIYPEELEQQAVQSPLVLECLALGYREPGEEVGERVGLIAVPDQAAFDELEDRSGTRFSTEEIEMKVRDEIRLQLSALSAYKRPRRIQIHFDEFEKTTTQKIKRYLYAIDTVGE